MKKIIVKPINATTVVSGKYAESVINQANKKPSQNFTARSEKAITLLHKMKG